MTQRWDVIIIGAGLAGYVAANYLAKTNLSILVLEKAKHVGGRARTKKINQHYFNLGPHALYKAGKAKAILEELGVELNGKSPRLSGCLFENNVEYVTPFTPLGIFSTQLLNWRERVEWLSTLLKLTTINPEVLAGQTFQQWVQQVVRSRKVESLVYLLGRLATYCHAPEKMSAMVMVAHLKMVMKGVLYLDGGWQSMIDQLHNKTVISGIQIRSHSSVKQITHAKQSNFKITLTNDEEIHGEEVIYTGDPHGLHPLLNVEGNSSQSQFFSTMIPIKGATLDIALSELPNPNRLFALSITDPYYYSVHSNYARLSDDRKGTILHVFKYHSPNSIVDGRKVRNELEQFLERLQPGWQKYVLTSRFLPQITVNQRLPEIGDEQKLHHSNIGIPGLYIAGDWTSPHSILSEGAVSSGKQAATEIIQKRG